MKIFIDHTEARHNSRLPDKVIDHATVLTNLEHLTGADLVLSPLDKPEVKELTRCPASVQALKIHCQAGILIQRKSGGDFIGSIPKLPEIQFRMQRWGLAWLLVTGEIKCSPKQQTVINRRTYGYSYWATIGTLDSWQLRGGGITILSSDTLIAKWMSDQCKRLSDASMPSLILPQRARQALTQDEGLNQTVATLMTFPRIGQTTAVAIAKRCGGLRAALQMLGDPTVLKRKDKVDGVGPKLVEEFRKIMGLKEGEGL